MSIFTGGVKEHSLGREGGKAQGSTTPTTEALAIAALTGLAIAALTALAIASLAIATLTTAALAIASLTGLSALTGLAIAALTGLSALSALTGHATRLITQSLNLSKGLVQTTQHGRSTERRIKPLSAQ